MLTTFSFQPSFDIKLESVMSLFDAFLKTACRSIFQLWRGTHVFKLNKKQDYITVFIKYCAQIVFKSHAVTMFCCLHLFQVLYFS